MRHTKIQSLLAVALAAGLATAPSAHAEADIDATDPNDVTWHVKPQYPGWYPGKYPDLKRPQKCAPENHTVTAPAERFIADKDGTAVDKATGLMWMRCSLGHTWTGETCEGDTLRASWEETLNAVQELNKKGGFAGHTDWRVPNMKELGTIVERSCVYPAVNMEIFPTTELWYYWVSTPSAGITENYEWKEKRQWGIDFADGKENAANFGSRRVRLVRDPK